MIIKLITGNGFVGALRYLTRAGMEEEIKVEVADTLEAELSVGDASVPAMSPGKKSDESDEEEYYLDKELDRKRAKILDARGVSFDYDDDDNMIIDTKQVGRNFRLQTMAYQGKGTIRKPVYHWVMSYSPKDKVTEEQMLIDADEFLEKAGFDDTQRVTIAHYDKEHKLLHIITNIVDNHGNRISTMGLIDKAHMIAADITNDRKYTWGDKVKEENITPEHIHNPHDRAREVIEPKIREALAASTSLSDFQEKLIMDYGIMCNFTVAKDGNRGRLSFCYEYEGQQHSFNGSSVARDLSFGYVNQAIMLNKQQEEANAALRTAYGQMIPTIKGLNKTVDDAFLLYRDVKQSGIAISTETSQKYGELKQSWTEFRRLNQDRRNASTAGDLIKGIGGMIMLLNPLAGLLAIAIGKISTDIRLSNIQREKEALLTRIEGIKTDIETLQQQKAQIKIEKQERLKDYLQAKDARNEFCKGMDTMKAEMNEIKGQLKPKRTFDFKAARQQAATPAVPISANPTAVDVPPSNTIDIYSILLAAKDKDSLDLALMGKKAVIEPMKDRFGGVADFKVTLAAEGRVVNASSLVPDYRMRQMLDKWGELTGEPLAYRQEIQREIQNRNHRKLADICAKMDAASPENAPRIPMDISFLPDGEIKVSYYNSGRREEQEIKVDANGKMRFNGLVLDVNTGKYTQQSVHRQTQHHSQEESQGEGKGYGGRGI